MEAQEEEEAAAAVKISEDGEWQRQRRRRHLGRRLLLLPLPFQGHVTPMFQLGEILYSCGFSITIVYTLYDSPTTPTNHHPHFQFSPIHVSPPEGASFDDPPAFLLALNEAAMEPLKRKLRTLLLESSLSSEEEPIVCMISDSVMFAAREAATEVGLPNVTLRTSSAICFLVYAAFPMLREKGYLSPTKDLDDEEPVAELPPFRRRDLPNFSASTLESKYEAMTRLVEHVRSSRALVHNTFEALEPAETAKIREDLLPLPYFPVGPLHKLSPGTQSSLLPQDRTCLDWLDALDAPPRSVLYVSLGSTACMSEGDLLEMARGLAASRQRFLWVLRPGSVQGHRGEPLARLLPEGFLEETTGRVVGWAPQQEVLRHPRVGGFWTHCGWNSTLEGVCEGVPMLCWPYFADQMVNARIIRDVWKVGVGVGRVMRREEVEGAVRRLMVEEEGRERRRRAMDIKTRVALSWMINSDGKEAVAEGSNSRWHVDKLVQFILSLE